MYVFGALCGYVAFFYPIRSIILLLYGLGVITYLLFQGQRYWQVKLTGLLRNPLPTATHLTFFNRARKMDRWLLRFMPLVGLLQVLLLKGQYTSSTRFLLAVLANCFAVLEYINYYHWQLMIDTKADVTYLRLHRRLKEAGLARDLARQRRV
jgi:hypothetical protein